jgi:hypothetical protein
MQRRDVRELVLGALMLAAACGEPGGAPDAAPPLDGREGVADAGADAAVDAGADAAVDGSTPPGPGFSGDNGALLSGPVIEGVGPADRRALTVEMLPGFADLVVGRAYLAGISADGVTSRLVLEVTNRGTRTYCDVQASLQYVGPSGPLGRAGSELVWASVRQVGGFTMLTCLLPGERAFLLDAPLLVGEATGVQVRTRGTAEVTGATTARLRPVRYAVTDGGVDITVENTGSRTARLLQAYLVYLDDDGEPLAWIRLAAPAAPEVAAGASVVLRDDSAPFPGGSSRLYVRVMYDE